jgi:hypothetical protein
LRHSEVGAAHASAFRPPDRAGATFVALAGGAIASTANPIA